MPDLMIPEDDELDFHEHMLENKSSVRNIRIIPGQDPAEWKEHWQDEDTSDMCYRLVYCSGCGYFVGDTGYRRIDETVADLWLMVLGDMRRDGYGSAVLKLMGKLAKKNGIEQFRVILQKDHPDLSFFTNRWFTAASQDDDCVVLTAKTSDLSRCRCEETVCSLSGHKE
jgi:GNAT superfamily N-acetyltransferase